jgi:hypothetical protein
MQNPREDYCIPCFNFLISNRAAKRRSTADDEPLEEQENKEEEHEENAKPPAKRRAMDNRAAQLRTITLTGVTNSMHLVLPTHNG